VEDGAVLKEVIYETNPI